MAGHSLQPFDQQICLPVLVVDSVHHGVLEGDPPAGDGKVTAAALHQPFHTHRPVDGHESGTSLIVRSVEGD